MIALLLKRKSFCLRQENKADFQTLIDKCGLFKIGKK